VQVNAQKINKQGEIKKMTNETTKKQIPSMNLSENVKRSYIEGEDFDPTGITFSVNEVEETLTTTAADLMMAGRVFPQKNLSVETTEIRFTWYGYDMYLPITVKSKNGEKGVPATRDLPLTNSVTAKWYPATGEMATTFTDIVFNKTPLNFALKHVHINNDRLVSCGRSWKLNLHQQVISASKSVLSTIKDNSLEECDYVYVDEYGKQFAFEEKYYFVDDNRNKIYCDKSNVSETDGGILIADIDLSPKQAYREFVSTNGLSLWDKYLGQTSVKILNEKSEQKKNKLFGKNCEILVNAIDKWKSYDII